MNALKHFYILLCFSAPQLQKAPADWYALSTSEFFSQSEVQQKIDIDNPQYELIEAAIFHATNQVRLNEGLSLFIFDPALGKAAGYHSENMRKDDFFAHVNKQDRNFSTPSERVRKFEGSFKSVAENIAQVTPLQLGEDRKFFRNEQDQLVNARGNKLENKSYAELAQNVVANWMDSPGHRQNILGQYSHLGCGTSQVFTEKKRKVPELLLTQNFGLK